MNTQYMNRKLANNIIIKMAQIQNIEVENMRAIVAQSKELQEYILDTIAATYKAAK